MTEVTPPYLSFLSAYPLAKTEYRFRRLYKEGGNKEIFPLFKYRLNSIIAALKPEHKYMEKTTISKKRVKQDTNVKQSIKIKLIFISNLKTKAKIKDYTKL